MATLFVIRYLLRAAGKNYFHSVKEFLLAASFLIPAPAMSQGGGITHVDTIPAPSLRNNLLGDPDKRLATVYLPPSYSKSTRRRYPVIYFLHGFSADHRAFIQGSYENLNVRITMDSLIRAGLSKDMIVVTPNARNFFDGGFYANSPVTGNWEDFIVRDLVRYMDRRYRTIRNRTGRGIAGHSMGGFGAFRIGMRNPDTFSAIYMLSAYGLSEYDSIQKVGALTWKKVVTLSDRSDYLKAGIMADLMYGLAGVYSPNPGKPPFFVDFPFRLEGDSLILVPEVAAKWRMTPLAMVPAYAENLRRMRIGFDGGTDDAHRDIPVNVVRLGSILDSLRIPHESEVYRGAHMVGIRGRIESKMIPFFSRALRSAH
jgi:pimeloyl-ACP methyl ester carboxylesterase